MSARVGDVAVLDGLEAMLVAHELASVRERRTRNGLGMPEALVAAMATLTECADAYRAAKAGSAVGTSTAPKIDSAGTEAICWLSTRNAAKEIGISCRAITKAAESGRYVNARKRGGVWEISRVDVERHREQRRKGTAR